MSLPVLQSLSPVQLSVTPWTAAHQVPRSFTISWSWLKLLSVEVGDAIQYLGGVNPHFVLIFQSHHVTTFLWVAGFHCLIFYGAFLPLDARAYHPVLLLLVNFIRFSYQGDSDFQNKRESVHSVSQKCSCGTGAASPLNVLENLPVHLLAWRECFYGSLKWLFFKLILVALYLFEFNFSLCHFW